MKSYEIERKYLVKQVPENLASYPFHEIEQGYLCTEPVVGSAVRTRNTISLTNPKDL